MSGLFGLLQMGKRSLVAHQFAQNIVGNNISNAGIEGYTRQTTQLGSGGSIETPWGQIGMGVQVDGVMRSRDALIDKMYRDSSGSLGDWETKSFSMQNVEAMFTESDNDGIGARMDSFFNSWQDLANAPESSQARLALREQAQGLVDTFHRISNLLTSERQSINTQVVNVADRINDISSRIASLNERLPGKVKLALKQENDALDERDRLLDELSDLVDIKVIGRDEGGIAVYIGSINLIEGPHANKLSIEQESNGKLSISKLYDPGGNELKLNNGRLKGLLELRDVQLKKYEDRLNTLSRTLVKEVNSYHKAGYTLEGETDIDFFDAAFIDADSINLSEDVLENPDKIAAASIDADGDNGQALLISALKDAPLVDGDGMREFYNTLITEVGVDSRFAIDSEETYGVLQNQAALQREGVSGVSLDEEMVDMIKYEQAYRAAARMVTTVDSMIETILSLK